MRIVHIYKDYFPVIGGIENHVRLLAEGQARAGHDVTVLVTNRGAHSEDSVLNGVRVVKAARLAHLASTPLSLSMLAWVRRLPADVAHLHFPFPPGEVANRWFGRARRTVVTFHSDVVRQAALMRLYRPLLATVLRRVDRVIATSRAYAASSPVLRQWADRCTVIPLGIDVARFERVPADEVAARRARLGAGPIVLYVGKLRYYKGLTYLLDALAGLDARLVVVGSGPLEADLRRQVHERGLGEAVAMLGELPDAELPFVYHAADVFVLPSSHRSEAFGAVLLEAMAAGRPVISTELGTGTSFVNLDGVTGVVVPPRDAGALRRALAALLADATLRARMGAAGRARVAAEFTADTMVRRVTGLYEEVLAAGRRGR